MINAELQKEILAYGSNLHPSQRGLFLKARKYPRWKKKLFLLLFVEDCSGVNTMEELLERVAYKEDSGPENPLLRVLLFPFALIQSFLVLSLATLFTADLLKQKTTWYSVPMERQIEALSLAAMID